MWDVVEALEVLMKYAAKPWSILVGHSDACKASGLCRRLWPMPGISDVNGICFVASM